MNRPLFDHDRDARSDPMELAETEALSESGFTPPEIRCVLRLRDWYEQGGSDRVPLIHALAFLKFLRSCGQLPS